MHAEPRGAAEFASTAAEAIRSLTYATLPEEGIGLVHPDDARSTVASLSKVAERLPRAFDHLLEFVTELSERGHLHSATGTLDEDLQAVHAALFEAAVAATTLHEALDRGCRALGSIRDKK
jgi:hypothetical protein